LRTAASDDIRAAVALLEAQTDVQASAPVDSRNRGVAAAKVVVRKTVFFAINHLAEQMRALGWAAASVGEAAAERIEKLEARVEALEARLAALDRGSHGDSES
jgi:ubiquinone biosynthesis protein UbiJ